MGVGAEKTFPEAEPFWTTTPSLPLMQPPPARAFLHLQAGGGRSTAGQQAPPSSNPPICPPVPESLRRRRRSHSAMRLSLLRAMAGKFTPHPGYRYGMNRPGSVADRLRNPPWVRRRRVRVEPVAEQDWRVFKGDTVQILQGKDVGKQGLVTQVIRERNWVILEGLNVHYRYLGKTDTYPGTYVASEAPLLVQDVTLVDPTDRQPTEVEWRYTEEGERVRVSLRTGRIIPKPIQDREDGIIPEQWIDGPKDTSVEDALEKTYIPSLKTFQEEIMELKGIVETRRSRKSYWY